MELPLGKNAAGEDGQQDLHEREQIRVSRRRQIDERLDRPLSDAAAGGASYSSRTSSSVG